MTRVTEELRNQIADAIARIPLGWCTLTKALAMAESIIEKRPILAVETGVYGGRSLIACALAMRSIDCGHIVGIDPYSNAAASEGESEEANKRWWESSDLRSVRDSAEQFIAYYGLQKTCCLIPSRSEDILYLFPSMQYAEVDFLHIDANHTELASCRDVENWLPRMRPGGIVWFDDSNWATTQKALGMLRERCDQLSVVCEGGQACAMFRVK